MEVERAVDGNPERVPILHLMKSGPVARSGR
jgi:hypothetical protein